MKSRFSLLATLLGAILIAGCGGLIPPTPTPTPPPTDVPTAVPTATTAPTRPGPTAAPTSALPPAIAFALTKTQSAKSLKYDFAQVLNVVQGGKTQEIPVLTLKGEDSTLNRHLSLSGTTSDTNEFISYEVIVVGNDAYIKGVSGVPGADQAQWYILPESAQAGVRQLPSARGLIASFSPEDVEKAKFTSSGKETLDNEVCTVWSAGDASSAQALIGVTADSALLNQLGEIDNTEVRLWTCADGYIHQMTGEVAGHSAANKSDTVSLTLNFVMNEFDAALTIEPPADAKPFPTPEPTAVTGVPGATADATPDDSGSATPPATEPAGETPAATETTAAGPSPTP